MNPFANERARWEDVIASAWHVEARITLLETSLYSALAFLLPLALASQPQLVLGTLVNFLLFAGAFYIRGPLQLLPLVVLPSLGALTAGALFGGLTPLLLLFAPAIWAGNAALVMVTKYARYSRKWNYDFSVGAAIALKVAVIGGSALALYSLGVVPFAFLLAMSGMQLATATIAAVLFWPVFKMRSGG